MIKTPNHATAGDIIDAVNWNNVQDDKDLEIWNRLTANLWLPEKVALSNDLQTWNSMTDDEQAVTMKVFAGLTMLDTMQGTVGAISLMPDAITQIEEAVYTQISYMESVHAKSYSNIFMTLADTPQINNVFRWARENEELQRKASTILDIYKGDESDPLLPGKKKIASTILESFLFYSGFYAPLYFAAHSKLGNTADIIRLIIRDEAVHGLYIGYKHQQFTKTLPEADQEYLKEYTFELLYDLYENECQYTEDIYDPLGLTEDVKRFLRYNGNKALNNLGYEGLWPQKETNVSQSILASLDPGGNENHDFFSGSGSSYVMGKAEDTHDDDWDF